MKLNPWRNKKAPGEASFAHLFHFYKYQAKSRGYSFDLTKDQFRELTQQNCFYCGAIPAIAHKRLVSNGSYVCNGVDRKDNAVGYTTDNCVGCCTRCNMMKKKMSVEDFIRACREVAAHQSQQ